MSYPGTVEKMIIRTTNSTFYKNVQDKKQDNIGGGGPKFFQKKGADFMYNVNDVSNLNE